MYKAKLPAAKKTMIALLLLGGICISWTVLSNMARCLDPESNYLTSNTKLDLVDWHICGLWVINSPVVWFRVTNYNSVPIHDVTLEYKTFTEDGRELNTGSYTIEGEIPPGTTKNFIEQYIGLVDLYTEKLSVKLSSVRGKHND